MTDLNAIINSFSEEENLQFVQFLQKKNKRNDTKNIQLFHHLAKEELSSDEIFRKLYKSSDKSAYHALRKRLYQSLIDFIANNNLQQENSVDMQIIKFILAARSLFTKNQYQSAYKILNKAESLANEHYMFSILNEIYHTQIQYAYAVPEMAIEDIIEKFEINQKHHLLEDQLNIVYAKIRRSISDMTYKGEVIDFQNLLKRNLKKYNINPSEMMSFKSLYQLMKIMSISAFATNDYLNTEPFLIETYQLLKTHKTEEKQLYYHIEILYMIANTLFRNKKFDVSQKWLQLMHEQMQDSKRKYYNAFKLRYNLLLALNYNYTHKQEEAILLLKSFKNSKHSDLESLLDIYLTLLMCFIQKEAFQNAIKLLSDFYHTDAWYTEKAGKEWVIKKNLVEIILYIELGEIDLVESRLRSFKRNYFPYLKKIGQERVITYLGFVERYYKNPENVTSEKFKRVVENSFDWIEPQREDIFVMSFYAWLKSKMERKSLYITTMELIEHAKTVN